MAVALLDPSLEAEAHVQARLDREPILWVGTVSSTGQPHMVPVWFCWADPTIVVFSQPGTVKLGHLQTNPGVSIALDSAEFGTDVVLGEGRAEPVGVELVDAAAVPPGWWRLA